MSTLADFVLIQDSHNQFPPDTAFPKTNDLSDGIEKLGAIIVKYNAQRYFKLRLLHYHEPIPQHHILLGSSITEPPGFWTRPTPISHIDLKNIHAHIISVDTDEKNTRLLPSEFREGPPKSINIDSNFFTEFSDYLRAKGLGNTFGLEVIQGQAGRMFEFSFETGSLLISEAAVKGKFQFQETGWSITVKDGAVDKDGETRCVIIQGQHIRVTKRPVKGVSDALKILRDQGVL